MYLPFVRAPRLPLAAVLAAGAIATGPTFLPLAGVAEAQAPTTTPASSGTLEGTVTAAGSTRPLGGARVTVVGTGRTAVVDEDGHFRVAGLAAGSYVVTATAIGREVGRITVRVAPEGTTTAHFALGEGSLLLPGVVVSATRAEESAREVAATVNVMPRAQVQTSPARTVDDLLREAPGVELPRTSSTVSGPEEIVSIRGVDEGRTLVLSDGVPLNDPWGEWIQWNRVPKQAVDHVEILEGGGSSLYGNYAMGGVIQLFRRPIVERGFSGAASGGSRGAADASLYGTTTSGPWGFSLGGDYGTGGGYTLLRPDQRGPVDRDSKVTRQSVDGRVEYALSPASRLFASADLFGDDRELGTDFTSPNRRTIGSGVVGGSFGGVAGGRLDASVFGQSQRYDSRQSRVSADRTTESLAIAQSIPSHDLGGSVQWARAAGIFETVAVGGDARYMHGRMDEQVYDPSGTSTTGARSSGGSQVVGGAFVQGVLAPAEPLRVEASARVDGWRSYAGTRADATGATPADTSYAARTNAAFSPRLGVRWTVLPSLTLRSSAYRAFRAPTLSEQYRTFFSGPLTFLGAPDLGPEHLTGVDAGLDWRPSRVAELRLTGFWNEMRELMTFVPYTPPQPSTGIFRRRENVGGARSRGGEAELALRPLDGLTVTAVYNYDDARVTKSTTPSQIGTYVARVPLQRASARVSYALPAIATLTGIYRYEGPSNTISGARLGSFAVVDADLRTPAVRGTSAFVAVENLFDRAFVVNQSGPLQYLGLPRTVRAGLAVSSF